MASGYPLFGSKLSYVDYLVAHEFVGDIASATRDSGQSLSMAISRQTRDVIASNEALAHENIRATEIAAGQITDAMNSGFGELSATMQDGFSLVTYELQGISSGIAELNASFHWGFGQMIAEMGRMNDALTELIKIAKTPVQTAAFNHYEIARDAFRQRLYQECLDSLDKAINGDHTSSGYRLEWRFHQMKGTLHLGFVNGDMALVNHAAAEESFALAARYAKTDSPAYAAQAFLSAGWAAYCQGKMKEALAYTEQALTINPNLGEALFQAAKVRMALGEIDAALPILSKAIDVDCFYTLKAAGDGDFQRHDEKLRGFLEAMRDEKYNAAVPLVKEALSQFRFWLEKTPDANKNTAICKANEFIDKGEKWPLLDIMNFVQALPELFSEMGNGAKTATLFKRADSTFVTVAYEENFPVEEVYQEEVVIKPGGLFHRAVTEMQTKTRTAMKSVRHSRSLQGIRLDFLDGMGSKKVSLDFCLIPSGSFSMGDKTNVPVHWVNISHDFYLGKYPVTQAQWEAVMGSNPNHFDGANRPVENVSWDDCQDFITHLNATGNGRYRLPTEAEWEYACRASSTQAYCFGDSEAQLGEYVWSSTNSNNQTQPVGWKRQNIWGLHDMHGNVWEWCQDWYGDYSAEVATDPRGPEIGTSRIIRGGSWDNFPSNAKSAYRRWIAPSYRDNFIGFRVVAVIE